MGGGADIIAYNSFKLLQEHGHEVFYFSLDTKPYFEENYEYAKYFYKLPQKKNFIDYLKNISNYYYNKNAAKQLEKLLDEINPDIVHAHTLYGLTYAVLKPCLNRKIPVVKTMHSAKIVCPAESLLLNNKTYCKKHLCIKGKYKYCILNKCQQNSFYSSICASLSNKINDLTGYHNKISKFVAPSLSIKNLVLKAGFNERKIELIENFINDDFLNIDPNYTNRGYFLFVGRLYPPKGVHYLLKAVKTLPKDIKFHIVGFGPQEDELKKYCIENNLDNVEFLGYQTQEQIKDEYKKSIALIVPSICFEAFGVINLEAFACGKPVIASKIGGIADIVENNNSGLLFEPENIEEMAKHIKTLWEDKELAITMGKNAKAQVNKYSKEQHYKKLYSLYNSIGVK